MTAAVRLLALACCLVLLGLAPAPAASPQEPTSPASARAAEPAKPAKWHTTVFSRVPSPGHPAYVHVARTGRVYSATYEGGGHRRSRVFEWTKGGTLTRSWTVPGQALGDDPGVQVANETRNGRLVLLETSKRRVMTLDVRTGRFRTVARLPKGAVPNYATWAPRGLYVTDYALGVVWRVSRTGTVSRWFGSPALAGLLGFGTTGIRYRPRQRDLLITQQTVGDGSTLPTNGHLYSLPVHKGRPGRLRTLWTSRAVDLPDGFGIGRSGHIYIAMAGLTQQLVELTAAGKEVTRFPKTPLSGANGTGIPFDTPCSATFSGTSVLVANQSAIMGDTTHMAILKVRVGERGARPFVPRWARFARG